MRLIRIRRARDKNHYIKIKFYTLIGASKVSRYDSPELTFDKINYLTGMLRFIWTLYWKWSGWKIRGRYPYELQKLLIIVAPHTTWKDVLVGFSIRTMLRVPDISFLGKKELFDGPLGWFFRRAGGIPVDRFNPKGMVGQVAELFTQRDRFILAMAPEGTRKRVDKLRSGFYHIAHTAQVPLLMAGLDFKHKEIVFSEPFYTTGDSEADFNKIIGFFSAFEGARPEQDLRHLGGKSTRNAI